MTTTLTYHTLFRITTFSKQVRSLRKTMPFVLFKLVRADGSSVNPAMEINNTRALSGKKILARDSIAQQANLENRDTIHVQNTNNEVKLYPNPTSDFVSLEIENFKANTYYYTISNSMGQILVNQVLVKDKLTRIDIGKFQKGIYQIEVISKDSVINLQLVVL